MATSTVFWTLQLFLFILFFIVIFKFKNNKNEYILYFKTEYIEYDGKRGKFKTFGSESKLVFKIKIQVFYRIIHRTLW